MMHADTPTVVGIPIEAIGVICAEVWKSFLGSELIEAASPVADDGTPRITGCVLIAGDWDGAVLLECPVDLARTAAELMFAQPADELSLADVADAIGELVNMVGGNIKSLLPGSHTLSTPTVANGPSSSLYIPGTTLATTATLTWLGQPLVVTIWQS